MDFLKKLASELERRAGTRRVPVQISLDEAGYLDRTCPHEPCGRGFKVLFADDSKFGEVAWCVYCGHEDRVPSFGTEAQGNHGTAVMMDDAAALFHDAMRAAADASPRSTRTYGGKHASLTITEEVSIPDHRAPARIPPTAWAVMRVEATCGECGCRFAGIGGCFFCAACGHRSPELTFEETLRRMRDALSKQHELEAAIGTDYAADIMTKMAESDVQSLVTAFEAFAKDSFPRLAPLAPAPRRNVFQNLAQGSELWTRHGGRAFDAIIDLAEHAELSRFFQQRHVLTHGNGVVDVAYLSTTADPTYKVGQRLAMQPRHVLRMAELVEKLVAGLRADLNR